MTPDDLVLTPLGLRFRGRRYPCTLGRGGVSARKREGDGATPQGEHRIVGLLYRPDRMARPTDWAVPIRPGDLWSDDAGDEDYNLMVRAPYPHSHEVLRRVELVNAKVAHDGITVAREERSRSRVGKQFLGKPFQATNVHRRDSPCDHGVDLRQQGEPLRGEPRPGHQRLESRAIHVGEPLFVGAGPGRQIIDPDELCEAKPQGDFVVQITRDVSRVTRSISSVGI